MTRVETMRAFGGLTVRSWFRSLTSPRVARPLRLGLTLASVVYLVVILVLGINELRALDWAPYARAMLLGYALYPIAIIAQAGAWALATGYLRDRRLSFSWIDVQIFAASYLLKRLPGGVWQVAGRIVAYRGRGVHPSQPIAASAIELSLTVANAGALYLSFGLLAGLGSLPDAGLALAISAVAGGIAAQVVSRIGWLRQPPEDRSARNIGLVVFAVVAVLYLASLAVASLILQVLVHAGGNPSFALSDALATWGFVALASTVIVLLPVGLGIREITLTIVLAPFVSRPVAVAIAVLLRLLYIAGDVIWGLAVVFVSARLSALSESPDD